MPTFPSLKTSAVAQYPLRHERVFATQVFRFVDLGEQRARDRSGQLRRWRIELSKLDSREIWELTRFFVDMRGSRDRFEFPDPVSGTTVSDCRLLEDEMTIDQSDECDSATVLTVQENE